MDNIDLFDKYIKAELTEKELQEFDIRLKSDKNFADDFKVYSATVIGICKEAEQDNKDFEMAMKNISEEQLRKIIGKKNENKALRPAAASKIAGAMKPKLIRNWMWQAACWAAIIGGAAIWIVIANRTADTRIAEADRQIDNALYSLAYVYEGPTRGSYSVPDLNTLTDEQLKEILPEITLAYDSSNHIRGGEIDEDLYEYGYPLAMAYLRLHERDKALAILNNLISKLSTDREYDEEVSNLKSIVNALK